MQQNASTFPHSAATRLGAGTPERTSAARTSPLERHGSTRDFERLGSRVWVVLVITGSVAMTAVICRTAHLLG